MLSRKFARHPITSAVALVVVATMAAAPALAATYYWDSDGTVAGFGTAAGTWGTSAFWTLTASGGSPHSTVTATTTGDTVNFGTATLNYGNASVGVAAAGVSVNKIVFGAGQTTGITLGTAGTTITMGGTSPSITVNNAGQVIASALTLSANAQVIAGVAGNPVVTLNGAIGGSAGLTFTTASVNFSGATTVIRLGASSGYSGSTTITLPDTTAAHNNSLTVRATTANALPTTTVLTLDGYNGAGSGRTVEYDLNGNSQTLAGLQNVARSLRLQRISNSGAAATLTINNTSDYIFSGQIYNTPISLVKSGAGVQTLSGANNYSGGTAINGGILTASHNSALGSGTVTIGAGAVRLVVTDGITIANNITIDSGTTGAAGRGLIENSGAGNATLSGGTITINAGVGAGGHFANAGSGTLTVNNPINSASATVTFRRGAGIFSGGGSYAQFAIAEGTVKLGANNGLSTGSTLTIGSAAAGDFDLANYDQQLAGIVKGGAAARIGNSVSATVSTLTTTGISSYSGVIADNFGAGTGQVALNVNGGQLTLSGNNTFTGLTTISGGVLALASSGSIDSSSDIVLAGGTFDTSAKVGGHTVNNLAGIGSVAGKVTVATSLAIGTSPGTMNFQDLSLGSSATYAYELTGGGSAADLGNVSGLLALDGSLDLIQFGVGTYTVGDVFTLFGYTAGNLTGTFAGLIDGGTINDAGGLWEIDYDNTVAGLNGGSGTSFVTITAVPEPSAALLGLFGLLVIFRRRREQREPA